MLAQSSELFEWLRQIDSDVLGAVSILGTIGVFVTSIVTVACISRTWNNIAMMKMNQTLVKDLLNQGYSVDDIERLAFGGPRWDHRFKKLVRSASDQMAHMIRRQEYPREPSPPVKQSA